MAPGSPVGAATFEGAVGKFRQSQSRLSSSNLKILNSAIHEVDPISSVLKLEFAHWTRATKIMAGALEKPVPSEQV
jgi:hypothetical protein